MKEIDESFFKNNNEKRTIDSYLAKGEKVLWKGCPKKISFVFQQTISLMPIAILWGLIDVGIIITICSTGAIGLPFFLIPFFALHMMPVWVWIGNMVKARNQIKSICYVITNQRVIAFNGKQDVYIENYLNLGDIVSSEVKVSSVDKILKTGDVYITGKDKNIVLFDLPDAMFINEKLNKINETLKQSDFNSKSKVCSHCGSNYDKDAKKCPYCGANE